MDSLLDLYLNTVPAQRQKYIGGTPVLADKNNLSIQYVNNDYYIDSEHLDITRNQDGTFTLRVYDVIGEKEWETTHADWDTLAENI